ncbi:hypothetical protein HDK77DRAFT_458786 [Phyllosticta capitalensis]
MAQDSSFQNQQHLSLTKDHVEICLNSFDQLRRDTLSSIVDCRGQISASEVENFAGRLRLWAGNAGVFEKTSKSFDYRLRDSLDVVEEARELLDALIEDTREASAILRGEKVPFEMRLVEDGEDEPDPDADSEFHLELGSEAGETELGQLKNSLKITLRCLATIATVTEHPAPLDFIACTLQRPDSYRKECETLVEGKFPDAPNNLKERLVDTMLIRREYLDYREAQTKPHQRMSTSVTRERTHPKSSAPEVVLLGENPSNDEDSSDESTENELEIGKSLPPVHLGEPFQCPLCFLNISVPNNKSWKKHIAEDLCPYICTFDQCGAPLNRFVSRRSWFAHEMEHFSKWKCPESCKEYFDTKKALILHLKDVHHWIAREGIPGGIAEACQVLPECHSRIRCPLCRHEVCLSGLEDHLGQHQEHLAVFALQLQTVPAALDGLSASLKDSTVQKNRDDSSIKSGPSENASAERGKAESPIQSEWRAGMNIVEEANRSQQIDLHDISPGTPQSSLARLTTASQIRGNESSWAEDSSSDPGGPRRKKRELSGEADSSSGLEGLRHPNKSQPKNDTMVPQPDRPSEMQRANASTDAAKEKTKTKSGCKTCRRRKKKCDGTKPICQNCLLGGFVCEGYLATTWPKTAVDTEMEPSSKIIQHPSSSSWESRPRLYSAGGRPVSYHTTYVFPDDIDTSHVPEAMRLPSPMTPHVDPSSPGAVIHQGNKRAARVQPRYNPRYEQPRSGISSAHQHDHDETYNPLEERDQYTRDRQDTWGRAQVVMEPAQSKDKLRDHLTRHNTVYYTSLPSQPQSNKTRRERADERSKPQMEDKERRVEEYVRGMSLENPIDRLRTSSGRRAQSSASPRTRSDVSSRHGIDDGKTQVSDSVLSRRTNNLIIKVHDDNDVVEIQGDASGKTIRFGNGEEGRKQIIIADTRDKERYYTQDSSRTTSTTDSNPGMETGEFSEQDGAKSSETSRTEVSKRNERDRRPKLSASWVQQDQWRQWRGW